MARTMTRAPAAQVHVNETHDTSWDRVWARETSKILVYLPPWLVGVLTFGLGCAFHVVLDSEDADTVAWMSWFMTACSMVLAAITYGQSHARGPWGRAHTTGTTFLSGMWVLAATFQGPLHPVVGRVALVGGVTIALSWNIRSAIRQRGLDQPGAIHDRLGFLFGQGAQAAGMPAIEARTTTATEHKVQASVQLEPGRQTADDLSKKIGYVESGMGLPPGSITTEIDPDDASKARVTVSDPRVMKHPIAWPGPSRPGSSIADPIRIGLWQDLDEIAYVIVGHHVQVMGQTGSGKSIGGAWNFLAEIVTRTDAAVFAGDITKGRQTLGPLAEALHRFETTKPGVKAMLAQLQARVKERTDHLAAKGLQKWKPGCGLTYWVIWLEEFPDIYDALTEAEKENFLSMLKAIRSAGGTIVMSLQRSDYTQMPTLARGQLAKMCFGVDSTADASFGLSEKQQDAGARPELWTNGLPGMAYLDAPSIPEGRIAMPLRTYAWGITGGVFDDEAASSAMRAHAARWPAAGKTVDPGTAELARISATPADQSQGQGQGRGRGRPEESAAPPGEHADLLAAAAELVVTAQYGSTAMVQRKLRIDVEHAELLMGELERLGMVGPERDGRREVLIEPEGIGDALAKIGDDSDARAAARTYQQTEDPDPGLQAGPDDPIPDLPEGEPPLTFAPPQPRMSAAERGQALIGRLQQLWDSGARDFATGDLKPLWTTTDMSRAWVQKQLKKLAAAEIIGRYDDEAQRYGLPHRPEVP